MIDNFLRNCRLLARSYGPPPFEITVPVVDTVVVSQLIRNVDTVHVVVIAVINIK